MFEFWQIFVTQQQVFSTTHSGFEFCKFWAPVILLEIIKSSNW